VWVGRLGSTSMMAGWGPEPIGVLAGTLSPGGAELPGRSAAAPTSIVAIMNDRARLMRVRLFMGSSSSGIDVTIFSLPFSIH